MPKMDVVEFRQKRKNSASIRSFDFSCCLAMIYMKFVPPSEAGGPKPRWLPVLVHSSRTAVAAVTSLLAARLFRLPEAYWAPITTLVIAQSSLGTAVVASGELFIGTALGAAVGAIVASHFGPGMAVFVIGVFILGILSAAMHSDRSAYRLAGVTLAIVLLVPRAGPASRIALHRFLEVCIGIAVALIFTAVWPEKEETPRDKH